RIDGDPPEVLATISEDLHAATIVARHRAPVGRAPPLVVVRRRMLTPGLRETVTLRNPGSGVVECRVALEVSTDFAALFDVKEGRAPPGLHAASRLRGRTLEFRGMGDAAGAVTTLDFSEPIDLVGRRVCVDLVVPPKGERSITVDISAQADDGSSLTVHDEAPDRDDHTELDHLRWRSPLPSVDSDDERLAGACRRAVDDLAALRIVDDRYGPSPVLAAGVPWFMTLFGRDSLIASWMALPLDPSLALTTLRVLGQLQGQEVDDRTEEQPGRILHEVRFGRSSLVGPGGGPIYYGSADATPLYVALAGELARWGAPPDGLA